MYIKETIFEVAEATDKWISFQSRSDSCFRNRKRSLALFSGFESCFHGIPCDHSQMLGYMISSAELKVCPTTSPTVNRLAAGPFSF